MVRRVEFDSVEGLLELAVDAEQTVENSKTFMPPPPPTAAILPEMAYNPIPKPDPQRKSRDTRDGKVAAAAGEKGTKSENLEEMIRRLLKESLSGLVSPGGESSGKKMPSGPRRGRGYQSSGRTGGTKPLETSQGIKAAGSPSSPASPKDPGGNPPREPRPQLSCYSCGLPGYIARYCPQYSGNGKRGE